MECQANLGTQNVTTANPSFRRRGAQPPPAPPFKRRGAVALIRRLFEAEILPLERGSARRAWGLLSVLLFDSALFAAPLQAQTISIDDDALRDYNAGLEHVQKKKYAAAQQRFNCISSPTLSKMISLLS
jgi:TolA-binding protein